MKRFIQLACASMLAVAMASPSFAADMPRYGYKAPVYVAPYFNWTGFYFGLNVGYGWGKSSWTSALGSTGSLDADGWLAGGQLGYNLQTGNWVWGIETDLDYSAMKGSTATFCGAPGCETRNTWLGTTRGRLGFAWDHWMPYFTGGVAYGSVKMTPAAATSETETRIGYAVGLGLEYALSGAWSTRLEYLYANLGTSTCSAALCTVNTDVKFNANIIRAGLNYRF